MKMSGERSIPASREIVWRSLNDPEILKAAIPGCQELEVQGDNTMRAVAAVKVGPITARFAGKVSLLDLDPPNSYRIEGEGQGGAAGFARGRAKIRLEDAEGGTRLVYDVDAQVGGKIAQLGARMVDATAKQMSDAFFNRFSAEIEARQGAPEAEGQDASDATARPSAKAAPPAEIDVGALLPTRSLAAIGAGLVAVLTAVWLIRRRRSPRRISAVGRQHGRSAPILIDAARLEDLRRLQTRKRSMAMK